MVEVNGLIFDPAVCLPQPGGRRVGGPIFASIDLTANETTRLLYGVKSGEGLGPEALVPASTTLSEYAAIQPPLNIWILVVALAGRMGMDMTFIGSETKYGSTRRTLRSPS